MRQKVRQIIALLLVATIVFSCQMSVWAEDVQEIEEAVQVTGETSEATDEIVTESDDEVTEETTPEATEREDVVIDGVEEAKDKTILYVALDGNDSNAGTINAPFASVEGAVSKIKELKSASKLGKDGVIVYVREGEYRLEKTIDLNEEVSGTEDARIVIRNYPDETVDFIGAISLSWEDFQQVKDERILSRLADDGAKENLYAVDLRKYGVNNIPLPKLYGPYSYDSEVLKFLAKDGIEKKTTSISPELIINGEAMTVARYPNEGNMTIGEVIKKGDVESSKEPFEFVVNDARVRNWKNADEAVLTGTFMYSWGSLSTFLDSVNTEKNTIKSKYPIWHGAAKDQQFYIWNLLEEIDMLGEYYVDRKKGMLYIYAPETEVETIKYTLLDVPMVNFIGGDYITIKGINMKYGRNRLVIVGEESENIEVIGCEFAFNGQASSFELGGKNNKVLDCYFHDLDGGLTISGGDRATLTRANNVVENCKFERCDRLTKTYTGALYISGVGQRVSHCDVSEADHLVITLQGNFNEVSFNDISEACRNTDDMGAIYTGRNLTERGNIFKNNYIHDIGGEVRGDNGTHGIFLDDFWSAGEIIGNVFADITGAGVMFAGSYNVVDNNIFANVGTVNGTSMIINRSYNYGNEFNSAPFIQSVEAVPIHSDVWTNAFPEIVNVIDEDGRLDINNHIVVTKNVLYNSGEPKISDEVKKTLTYGNNVTYKNNPGFYDLANENYLLNEDSDVYTDIPEFEPIPFTRMGRYNDRATSRAKKGYVFCLDSPYVYKAGERVKADKTQAFVENETIYVPLRTGAEAVGANLTYDEATDSISIVGSGKLIEFADGATEKINVNGTEYTLSKPLINIEGSNYICVADLVNVFNRALIRNGNLVVVTDFEGLFNLEADQNLLRWLEEQLTVY